MLSDSMVKTLNRQMNTEISSAYKYMAMAGYCQSISMSGSAHWLEAQAKEELEHARKLYSYLNDLGARAEFLGIEKPKANFNTLAEVFEAALQQEVDLQEALNAMASGALDEKDNTTYTFLQWYLTEQVEEISTARTIVDQLKMVGNNPQGLFLLDRQLGTRAQ